jgi:toxin-antitoxin system PIN domain toxin
VIAVDTNLLVYAHRRDAPFHARAAELLTGLAEGRAPWALPWPCVHEFYAIVTHPRIYRPPSTGGQALAQLRAWLESPSVVCLAETDRHFEVLAELVERGSVMGPLVHDARVAALCASHGVAELWSADRDFSRFPGLTVRNPLL